MAEKKSRPGWWDYETPDPEFCRCKRCNADGMNRTGLMVVGLVGSQTLTSYGVPCPERCDYGLNTFGLETVA